MNTSLMANTWCVKFFGQFPFEMRKKVMAVEQSFFFFFDYPIRTDRSVF